MLTGLRRHQARTEWFHDANGGRRETMGGLEVEPAGAPVFPAAFSGPTSGSAMESWAEIGLAEMFGALERFFVRSQ